MRVALAQLNPMVGDVDGNADAIRQAYAGAVGSGAHLVVTGEQDLPGYPPEDLLLKPAFVAACADALRRLAAETGPVPLVVGFVEDLEGVDEPPRAITSKATSYPPLGNAAAVLRGGRVEAVYRKHRLPNYGVFDEARYFHAGTRTVTFQAGGTCVGVTICEDMWGDGGPVDEAAEAGARVVLNLNASPYSRGKRAEREQWASRHARASGAWVVYVNRVGGQDELVYDGDSFVMSPHGQVTARGAQFATDLVLADLPLGERAGGALAGDEARLDPLAEVYAALVLGTRDYVRKNGFQRALVGLSGGIDSAMTAVVAVDALGADAVTCVVMPSPYSSESSVTDAKQLIDNLGVAALELPIERVMTAFDDALAEPFADTEPGVAEENIQSRIRGILLMALSNKFGDIVLATGNKSEYAVGYATLYGDMAGGFAVLKDVPKTLVYELARWRNAQPPSHDGEAGEVIPTAIIDKPPSAELRAGQRDTDSLPPYEVLDPVLEAYVEQDRSVADIVGSGYEEALVREVARMVDRAEYKRRQAAPGIKITARAFGKDRRLPITQAWTP
ncbi:MAG TPA: NAD+ synthase [Egibacteraceae bacterium]|nr:NAD+ synthase [Actinomycetota bacterium]HWB72219.1 NAD+ synthase [Egibacteraceae bacterium]